MRIFLAVLILIFSFQCWTRADNIVIDELFGIKILDDISYYANKSDGTESWSEIASCSYEARKCGVKNGMFVGCHPKLSNEDLDYICQSLQDFFQND